MVGTDSYVQWLRNHVGRRKVFLPFVTVIVRDERQAVLLQRRRDFHFWGLPGGVLELDEDIETGARRELLEETGLTVGDLRLVGVYSDPTYDVIYPNGDQVQQFTISLEGPLSGGEMRPDGEETVDQRFVDPQEAALYDLPVWYRAMLADAQLHSGPRYCPPFAAASTSDQIASIRPFVGKARFSGIGAAIVLRQADGRMLMLQHVGEDHWRIPSGFSDLGENVANTAVREAKEELCLNIEPLRLIGVHASPRLNSTYGNGDQIRNVGAVFVVRCLGGSLKLDRKEIASMAWMTADEALVHVQPSRRHHYRQIARCLETGYFID